MNECDHIIGWDDTQDGFFKMDHPLKKSEYESWQLTQTVPNPFKYCPECGTEIVQKRVDSAVMEKEYRYIDIKTSIYHYFFK